MTPPEPWIRPRRRHALVLWSDREWRPATVLAWYRLPEPEREMMSSVTIGWLVLLETVSDGRQWYGYRPSALRPAG